MSWHKGHCPTKQLSVTATLLLSTDGLLERHSPDKRDQLLCATCFTDDLGALWVTESPILGCDEAPLRWEAAPSARAVGTSCSTPGIVTCLCCLGQWPVHTLKAAQGRDPRTEQI
jgi:hypothetical protein